VLVDGFYEGAKTRNGKQPYLIGKAYTSRLAKTPSPSTAETNGNNDLDRVATIEQRPTITMAVLDAVIDEDIE
jgi:hypothetical protein